MPKKPTIVETHLGPEFLFECTKCPHASTCMEQGMCQHEIPSGGDHDFDDKLSDYERTMREDVYHPLNTIHND